MTLLGFKGQNHPQQTAANGAIDDVDDRGTHPTMFDPLNARYDFTLDVAASPHNAKCERYFTVVDDGLAQSWRGERVWCNPPFSDMGSWVRKAWAEWIGGAELIVMVVPANRTEQGWWQDLIEPWRDKPGGHLRVEFLRGRIRFIKRGQTEIGPNERPPFGCALLVWERT